MGVITASEPAIPEAGQIQAVLLDLDGTLLDTITDLATAANLMRNELGLTDLPLPRIMSFVGKGADLLVHRTMTDTVDSRLEAQAFRSARASFDRHYTAQNGLTATPYPGVVAGLEALQKAGLKLACVTNKPQMFTDPLLERQGLRAYFDYVLGGDALARKKPDPMPLLHLAALFGLQPQQCLMVGDSVNDAQAARAAGMPVLLVPYGYNEGLDVATIDSDGIVSSLEQVAQMIPKH